MIYNGRNFVTYKLFMQLTTRFFNKLTLAAVMMGASYAHATVGTTYAPAQAMIQPNSEGSNLKITRLHTNEGVTYTSSNAPLTTTSTNSNYPAFTSTETGNASSYASSYSASSSYDHLIREAAARHGVDPALIKAVIHTESGFNPRARSRAGAMGLMQLMPATARAMGVSNAYDPAQNINGGAKLLAMLQDQFGSLDLALAAYNAGPGNVRKHGGIPPFRETRNYVKKVGDRYNNIYRLDASLYVGYNENRTMLAMNTPAASVTETRTTQVIGTSNYAAPQNPNLSSGETRLVLEQK